MDLIVHSGMGVWARTFGGRDDGSAVPPGTGSSEIAVMVGRRGQSM